MKMQNTEPFGSIIILLLSAASFKKYRLLIVRTKIEIRRSA